MAKTINPRTKKPMSIYSKSNSSTRRRATRTSITKMRMAKSRSSTRLKETLTKRKALKKMMKRALNSMLMSSMSKNVSCLSLTFRKSTKRTPTLSRFLKRSFKS